MKCLLTCSDIDAYDVMSFIMVYAITATWRCRMPVSQWQRSLKLRCHWLRGLWQHHIAIINTRPSAKILYSVYCERSQYTWVQISLLPYNAVVRLDMVRITMSGYMVLNVARQIFEYWTADHWRPCGEMCLFVSVICTWRHRKTV